MAPAAPDPSMSEHLSPQVMAAFDEAQQLQNEGKAEAAIARLEAALANTSQDSNLVQFKERVSLAIAIAEFSVTAGSVQKAIDSLATEFGVASSFQTSKHR